MEEIMTNTISVIVPVYNDEQYIKNCVKSVMKQTYSDIELIMIDDGSTDRSREICEKLCEIDKRIKLVLKEHEGVSAARNTGIDVSTGKYLFFLDSDDLIHPQLLEELCRLLEDNHTMIATVGLYYADKGKFQKPTEWKYEDVDTLENFYLSNEKAKKHQFFTHPKTRLYAIGGKLILRSKIDTLRFDEKLTHGEDTWFVYQMLMVGADVSVLSRNWYYYRRTQNSSDKIYSIETCRSRYRSISFIRDQQIKDGMISDAACMEWDILGAMVEWYETGRKRNDTKLMKYLKNQIKKERKLWIYSKLRWYKKVIFYLGCEHYFIYNLITDILQVYYTVSNKLFYMTHKSAL